MTVVKDEDTRMHRVAVYGSLREGLSNHGVLGNNAKLLGTFDTPPTYTLYKVCNSFPGLKRKGHTSVFMEVYEVDASTLNKVNALEGYRPNSDTNHYDRFTINTPYGNAYSFEYNPSTDGMDIVENGDWTSYKSLADRLNK